MGPFFEGLRNGILRANGRAAVVAGVVAVLTTACGAQTSSAASARGSLKAVLAGAEERVEKTDVRASGRLVQIAASGGRTNNSLSLASHSFPDGLRTMITVTTPAHSSVRYLLNQNTAGQTTIEVLRKGEAAPARLAPERWGEGVAGTFFYPEDFADGQFFWAKQTVLPPQKYGARDCFVLRSEPGPGQPTVYASVTTWIDQKTGATVYVEAKPRNGEPTKQFVFYGIEQVGSIWLSQQVEAKIEGQPGSSMMIIEHGSTHANLERRDFDLTARPQRAGRDSGQ